MCSTDSLALNVLGMNISKKLRTQKQSLKVDTPKITQGAGTFKAGLRIRIQLLTQRRIRIQIFALMRIRIQLFFKMIGN
jgi:hypothetical protein